MTMPLRKRTRLLLIALLVLANNLAWIYLMPDWQSDTHLDPATAVRAAPMTTEHECANDGASRLTTLATAGNRNIGVVQTGTTTDVNGPVGTATDATDIPIHLSQDAILRRQMELDYFFQGDAAKKLQTIEGLAPQGQAIELFTKILQGEPDSSVRIAALNRLRHERSYAATALVISALDDPAAEVSATALNALVAGGDRTLLPILKERLASAVDQPLRNRYVQAIHELEYSASMAGDGVTNVLSKDSRGATTAGD